MADAILEKKILYILFMTNSQLKYLHELHLGNLNLFPAAASGGERDTTITLLRNCVACAFFTGAGFASLSSASGCSRTLRLSVSLRSAAPNTSGGGVCVSVGESR